MRWLVMGAGKSAGKGAAAAAAAAAAAGGRISGWHDCCQQRVLEELSHVVWWVAKSPTAKRREDQMRGAILPACTQQAVDLKPQLHLRMRRQALLSFVLGGQG